MKAKRGSTQVWDTCERQHDVNTEGCSPANCSPGGLKSAQNMGKKKEEK